MKLISSNAKHNLEPSALIEKTILLGQGQLSSTGALAVKTGKFTGRSPEDRFIVKDAVTENTVNWGKINLPIDQESFHKLFDKIKAYKDSQPEVYSRDAYACANPNYRLNIRIHTEFPWQNLFAYNMFLRPTKKDLENFEPDWEVYAFPTVLADTKEVNTRRENFVVMNFTEKKIIIGGTAYTGEIKKGIFSVLNYLLPVEKEVLPMHCSANVGAKGDTALFFGLSGTGKTTLSNDVDRRLIGDDEHGWSKESIFNFEGGCYAKTIDLSATKEPQIYKAIRFGALLENIVFKEDGCTVDYEDISICENTRVSYPIYHIDNIAYNSRGDLPQNIFFLTCDAFGILPPIAKLTKAQAMYHFISGYTAKIAGTEVGINEPVATFSSCFGSPFLPLHPTQYAEMLGKKIDIGSRRGDGKINIWLINTGWTGGVYGEGNRMELSYTRRMIKAALDGELKDVAYRLEPRFKFAVPTTCPDVPSALLNPRDTWKSKEEYDKMANELAMLFVANFKQYADKASEEILDAMPNVNDTASA
jgi:phosphoenolpyruvate carboxykinase (ATP)